MDSSGKRPEMGDGGVAMLVKPTVSRPTLSVPPRNPAEAFARGYDAATPSPMTFVSSLFAEQDPYADCKSFSQLLAGAMASPTAQLSDASPTYNGTVRMPTDGSFANRLGNQVVEASETPASGRSNTARFKSMVPSRLPIPRSPYLTIPPGLSPTTLLDSPVLFSTAQVEPSPTTGTFPLPAFVQESQSAGAPNSDTSKASSSEEDGSPSFVFKPYPKLATNPYTVLANMGSYGLSHQQALARVHAQAQPDVASVSSRARTSSVSESSSILRSVPSFSAPNLVMPLQPQGPSESTVAPLTESSEKVSSSQAPVAAYRLPHLVERPSDDGYNWRKYGQKQVKGGEYPRSYYKCTHPNCPVKKKVERSHDGQVTEIVYKGEHNHAKPQATRRSNMSGLYSSDGSGREASHAMALERADTSHAIANADSDRSSADPSSTSRWQSGGLPGSPEASLGSTSDDEGEASKAEDGNEDEPDSKHRRVEKAKDMLLSAPLRTIREPRVVVQTTSEVDILDDGYRWRKYGQKVVKGNDHPRSYYKCTNLGCSVRKHVERSSVDSKAVITTYEGKHNHDVPAAKNSNHDKIGTSTSVTFPPGPGHGGLDVSNVNTLTKSSASLQEQLFGKIFEDRFNGGSKMTVSVDMGSHAFMNGAFTSEQNRVQGGMDFTAQSAMNYLGSGLTGGRPLEGSDSFVQGFALRPKEEPGDVPPLGTSLPIYPSRSSSFVAQSLALGP